MRIAPAMLAVFASVFASFFIVPAAGINVVEARGGHCTPWRSTTEPQWRYSRVAGTEGEIKLTAINIDDWFFGVSAIGADGYESPVVFPGPAGTFERGGVAAAPK